MTCFRITFFLFLLYFSGLTCGVVVRCGVGSPHPAFQPLALFGHEAQQNSWPSMVAIFYEGRFMCGGVLIDAIHVLSAAHCFHNSAVPKLTVAMGMHRIKPINDAEIIAKVYSLENDIAILMLDWLVPFSPTISPACLPALDSIDKYIGREAVVIGWGLINGKQDPDVLQQVTVGIISNDICNNGKYKGRYGKKSIADHKLCASYPGHDFCEGGSGGPLMVQSEGKWGFQWIVVGIVSSGEECGDEKFPGVYTRVSSFTKWIDDKTIMTKLLSKLLKVHSVTS